MEQYEVLIVGGGVVGLTAALAMAQCNYTVGLIDAGSLQVTLEQPDMRVYAINKASRALLEELQVWPYVDESRVAPYTQMYVWDAANGAAIEFDARSIGASFLGAIVEESILKHALLEQVRHNKNIHLFPHSKVSTVHSLTTGIEISSEQTTWQGQLLIIAEGALSPTREQLKVPLTSWSYQQQAIIATVHTEKEHQNTAYQVFHREGPLAFLPLKDKHQCSIVWSADIHYAEQLMALNDAEFNKALGLAFAHKLGAVGIESKRHQFPLSMRHAKSYVGANWLLMGDAAHTIHPLAGLGLNVGLADVNVWYRLMKQNKKLTAPKYLGAYQRERKAAVWQTILLMEGFKQFFSFSFPPITTLRGLGLRFCNQATPLKQLFIQHAAGE